MSTNDRTIRFWVYHWPKRDPWGPNAGLYHDGGWVRLTLRPGESLNHYSAAPHEEGYSYHDETWRHAGDRIDGESVCGGSDCDGPISHHWAGYCPIERLAAHRPDILPPDVPGTPDWETADRWQRDVYAEAAGY